MTPRAAIVGPGRSGTGYIARVLNLCGVACGHEAWWNPAGSREEGLDCDSSWCALALGDLPPLVLYQVRHPLAVYSSLLHEPPAGAYRRLRLRLLPGDVAGDGGFAAAVTVAYTREALRRAEWGWRLEDVDAPLVARICRRLDRPVGLRRAAAALAATPRTTNRHTTEPRPSWADLPAGPSTDLLRDLAADLGYE